jgi:hypothetical protein
MLSRRFLEVHKPQVLRSLTLSKASPGAYSTYGSNKTSFYFILLHVMYCALRVGSC